MGGYIVEKNQVNNILIGEAGKYEFEQVSHGEIPYGASIFLISEDLSDEMSQEFLRDASDLPDKKFQETIMSLSEREERESIHMIRIQKVVEKQRTGERKQASIRLHENTTELL